MLNFINLSNLFKIIATLTDSSNFSNYLLTNGYFKKLLKIQIPENSEKFEEFFKDSEKIVMNLCESPYILQKLFLKSFLGVTSKGKISLEYFLSSLKNEVIRNKEVFFKSFINIYQIIENEVFYREKIIFQETALLEK